MLNIIARGACVAFPTVALLAHDRALGPLTAVVDGASMHPTFNRDGPAFRDRILLNRLYRQLDRGDVVVLRSPSPKEGDQLLIKRIVGLEGDRVALQSGGECVVPSGQVWVEGDNKVVSRDSRRFGPVDLSLVEARVALKIWPLRNFGAIGNVGSAAEQPPARQSVSDLLAAVGAVSRV